ncbi:hypothetical protein [Chroococcidiopsis sp. TS-821]|nr:hypothetical protein [Chroococcidiopsis sp. TS-821]
MPQPQPKKQTEEIDVDAGTLLLVVSALIFVPLLLVGFLSQ